MLELAAQTQELTVMNGGEKKGYAEKKLIDEKESGDSNYCHQEILATADRTDSCVAVQITKPTK